MSCYCSHTRSVHHFDGRCTECDRCFQFESADGAIEDMGTAPVVERRAVVIVRREREAMGSMPRGDE